MNLLFVYENARMPGRLDPLDDILDSQFLINGGNLHLGDHDVRDIQPAER